MGCLDNEGDCFKNEFDIKWINNSKSHNGVLYNDTKEHRFTHEYECQNIVCFLCAYTKLYM